MRAYFGNFMKALRCLLAVVLLAIVGATTPAATSVGTDHSDLWWNQSEPGWGIQLVQRDTVIFATLFTYDVHVLVWYSATLNYQGNLVWSGDLIVTSGPWFGEVPFAASTVTRRTVGTMKWVPIDVDDGTLTYAVDNVQVAKTLTRQVLAVEIYNSGRYLGAMHQDVTGCSNPGSNGSFEQTGALTITQTRGTLDTTGSYQTGAACSYQGAFVQSGQLGNAFGNYSCTDGDKGSVVLFEMQVMSAGLTGRIHATSATSGCSSTGWFGGDVQPHQHDQVIA